MLAGPLRLVNAVWQLGLSAYDPPLPLIVGGGRAGWSNAAELGRRFGDGDAGSPDAARASARGLDRWHRAAVPALSARWHAVAECNSPVGTSRGGTHGANRAAGESTSG